MPETEEYDDAIWEEDVEWAINKLRLGKAAGRDGIAPELVRFGGPELQKALQSLFQKVFSEKFKERFPIFQFNLILYICIYVH